MRKRQFSQVAAIERKGYEAFLSGIPKSPNPYEGGYNGGGSLQRWRRLAWIRGWELAQKEQREK